MSESLIILNPSKQKEEQIWFLTRLLRRFGMPFLEPDLAFRNPQFSHLVDVAMVTSLGELTDRERKALTLRYGLEGKLEPTLAKVGSHIPRLDGQGHVGVYQVNEIIRSAERKIRSQADELIALLPNYQQIQEARILRQLETDINFLQANWSTEFEATPGL